MLVLADTNLLWCILNQIKGDPAKKAAASRLVLHEMSFQKRNLVKEDSVLTNKMDS